MLFSLKSLQSESFPTERTRSSSSRTWTAGIFIVLSALFIMVALNGCDKKNPVTTEVKSWQPVAGTIAEQTVQTVTSDPQNNAVLYAGTLAGVFKSTDAGVTWIESSQGLTSKDITCLAVSPLNSSLVFCGTWGKGICKSRDAGQTWQGSWAGGYNPLIKHIAIVKNGNQIRIWAATNEGLFFSMDEGVTWLSSGGFSSVNVVYGFSDTQRVLASIKNFGMYRSLDGGAKWEAANTGLAKDSYGQEAANFLCADPTNTQKIVISTDRNVLYRSVDGGDTWQVLATSGHYVTERVGFVQQAGLSNNFWLASSLSGVLRSTDNGLTWSSENTALDLTTVNIKTIYAVSHQKTVALVGTVAKGIYRYEE
jgi:hypothetical protein